uniref:Leukemia inhibitory factor receptor-like n=1 Tax=Acanthochromis polyacanthus TaxID=80966 RepID=A0A3Q1EKW3_9TELE
MRVYSLHSLLVTSYNFTCIVLYFVPVWQSSNLSIRLGDRQSLVVSWVVNHSVSAGEVYEIQIGRTEKRTIVYNTIVNVSSGGSQNHTWISDLPLECVDHSVRIRHFYNRSVPSPWSNWTTNDGVKAKNKSKIYPVDQVLREGSNPKFCCVPPVGVNITGMAFGNKPYPLESVGDGVKAITVKNLAFPAGPFTFVLISCNDTTGRQDSLNYVSFPPQKPVNFNCATSDMTTVTCAWDVVRRQDYRNPQTHTLRIGNSGQAPISCKQSPCTFPAVPQLQEYNISVSVKDKLGEEEESYSFNILDRVFPIVEWDRVIPGVTNVTLSWVIQGNLTQMNPLCQVSAVPDDTTKLHCNDVSGLCEVKLEHLLPNTDYSTRVCCSVNGRLWGEWTPLINFTTDPLVTLDLWRRIQPLNRSVTLLWNPVTTAVNVQRYKVQWSQEGNIRTDIKDSRQSQAEIFIGPGKCDFTVQAVLHTGSSIPAHITIPPMDYTEKLPVQKRLSSTTDGGFNLTWDRQSTVTCSYTVEWCSYSCILGNAVPCTLQWMKVPEGDNTVFLPAENFTAGCRYTFNIYGCTENGDKLLEIQTGYSKELKPVQAPRLVEPVQSTSSSVTLEWRYNENDPTHPAFITGYLVTVQELFNMSVADPLKKSVTIDGLKQNQEYVCSVSALTKEGPGLPANITIRTRVNYSAHLAKILTPILLLLGCTFILWPQRKTDQRLHSQKAEECISCVIEIVNARPPLMETTTLIDPEPANILCSPGSDSSPSSMPPSCKLIQADYCPQSATLHWDRPTLQRITSITNKSYIYSMVEDYSEPQQVTSSEVKSSFEPSECLQESCTVIYGYISNVTL